MGEKLMTNRQILADNLIRFTEKRRFRYVQKVSSCFKLKGEKVQGSQFRPFISVSLRIDKFK